MDSKNQQCYQVAPPETSAPTDSMQSLDLRDSQQVDAVVHDPIEKKAIDYPAVVEGATAEEILEYLRSGNLWMVNSRRRNGLILCKGYHAEFAGPGAAMGGLFDLDCERVILVGNLSLLRPQTHKDRQDAYLIRRQWIKLTQQVTDQSAPLQRAQMILNQFENYFDQDTIARIPDEAFAMLVGVLPYSIRMARRTPGKLTVKVKA